MDGSIDGFNNKLPGIVRFILQYTMKPRTLKKPMAAGFQLPKKAGVELIAPPTGLEDGLAHIRNAIHRLQTDPNASRAPSSARSRTRNGPSSTAATPSSTSAS